MSMDAKHEAEELMNELLPVAKKMLGQYGEFYPYGGYMKPDGEIVHVGAKDPETDRPKSEVLIEILQNTFQEAAVNKRYKAVAIIFDVCVALPNSNRKSDAIQVCLDHMVNFSAEVFFPYRIENNKVIFGDTFAQEGKFRVFGK